MRAYVFRRLFFLYKKSGRSDADGSERQKAEAYGNKGT